MQVTDADRGAAAAFLLTDRHDYHTVPLAQAFARHREAAFLAGQASRDPRLALLDRMADLLSCALDEYEGNNGRITDQSPMRAHWSRSARAALAEYDATKGSPDG